MKKVLKRILFCAVPCLVWLPTNAGAGGTITNFYDNPLDCPDKIEEGQAITPILSLIKNNYGEITQRGLYLFSDKKSWQQFTQQHAIKIDEVVDFNQHHIIAAYNGRASTGGYSITVAALSDLGDSIVIDIINRTPAPGQLVTMALTEAHHIAKVPALANKPIIARLLGWQGDKLVNQRCFRVAK